MARVDEMRKPAEKRLGLPNKDYPTDVPFHKHFENLLSLVDWVKCNCIHKSVMKAMAFNAAKYTILGYTTFTELPTLSFLSSYSLFVYLLHFSSFHICYICLFVIFWLLLLYLLVFVFVCSLLLHWPFISDSDFRVTVVTSCSFKHFPVGSSLHSCILGHTTGCCLNVVNSGQILTLALFTGGCTWCRRKCIFYSS